MGFGVFGKLPQKRDFVALGLPRGVLEPFESWLQSAVAASRNELGAAWQDTYLVAPVWRFWIGRTIFGTSCAGSIIPSVDGVGRFFPLALFYCAEDGGEIAPPAYVPQEDWFAALDQRLMSVLDPEARIEVERLGDGLPIPSLTDPASLADAAALSRGQAWQAEGGEAADLLSAIVEPDYRALLAGRSVWWTNGGHGSGPVVYARNALPDPFFFAAMLRGTLA